VLLCRLRAGATSPGRIEHLLALPVRRAELVLGTFLGVIALVLLGAVYASAGLVLVLGSKTGV
jgi:Cu-processing system permease protein